MANKRISDLPSLDAVANSDLIPIVDTSGFQTKKIQYGDLKTSILAGVQGQINSINYDLGQIQNNITIIEGSVLSNTNAIYQLQIDLNELEEDVNEIYQSIEGVYDQIYYIDEDISSIQNQINSLSLSILSLSERVTAIEERDKRYSLTDPTSSNDETEGFVLGSLWINHTDNKIFFCKDATEGGAVWFEFKLGGGIGGGVGGAQWETNLDAPSAVRWNGLPAFSFSWADYEYLNAFLGFIIPASYEGQEITVKVPTIRTEDDHVAMAITATMFLPNGTVKSETVKMAIEDGAEYSLASFVLASGGAIDGESVVAGAIIKLTLKRDIPDPLPWEQTATPNEDDVTVLRNLISVDFTEPED